jgi:hypothetical protein
MKVEYEEERKMVKLYHFYNKSMVLVDDVYCLSFYSFLSLEKIRKIRQRHTQQSYWRWGVKRKNGKRASLTKTREQRRKADYVKLRKENSL